MRVAFLLTVCLLGLLAWAPSAIACSLAYQPFDAPTWEDRLRYVDATELREVRNTVEHVAAEGFFLSYARVEEGLLVAGQDGLGADCSGDPWLRLYQDGGIAWEREGQSRVWPHGEGALVTWDGKAYRWDGDLVRLPASLPEDAWTQGWTVDGKPVYVDRGTLVAGDVRVPDVDSNIAVAHGPGVTGVLEMEEGTARLHRIDGRDVQTVSWAGGPDRWAVDLAYADGWVALAGGTAYWLPADGRVVELQGDAVSVGSRGDDAVVFEEQGYVVHRDGVPVESRQRVESVWAQRTVGSGQGGEVEATTSTAPHPDAGGPATGGEDAPVAIVAPVLALLALAALRRRN